MTDTADMAVAYAAAMRKLRVAQQALDDLGDALGELTGQKSKAIPEKDKNGEPTWNYAIKRGVPDDIYVTKIFAAYAAEWGFTAEQAEILMHGADPASGSTYEGFVKYYKRVGTKWPRWSLVWQKWVRSEHERRNKRASGGATKFDQNRTRI